MPVTVSKANPIHFYLGRRSQHTRLPISSSCILSQEPFDLQPARDCLAAMKQLISDTFAPNEFLCHEQIIRHWFSKKVTVRFASFGEGVTKYLIPIRSRTFQSINDAVKWVSYENFRYNDHIIQQAAEQKRLELLKTSKRVKLAHKFVIPVLRRRKH